MNYLELINNYWDLREQGILTSSEGDCYLFLVHKCNRLGWKNPFNLSNQLCCGYLGVQEKSLIKYRNKLKQIGLIDFKSGVKGSNTEYIIHFPKDCKKYRESGSLSGSESGSESGSLSGEKEPDYIKQKQNQTKTNNSTGAKAPGGAKEKKEEQKTEYWAALVKCWFDFNIEKFGEEPSFAGADPAKFKEIIDLLKNRSVRRKIEWTEENAVNRLQMFLKIALQDEWLSKNFLLKNIREKYDTIVMGQHVKAVQNKQQTTEPRPKIEDELNYLYGRYREDVTKVTIKGIDHAQYSYLNKKYNIQFSEEQLETLSNTALQHDSECANNKQLHLQLTMKFALLEAFKMLSEKGVAELFTDKK